MSRLIRRPATWGLSALLLAAGAGSAWAQDAAEAKVALDTGDTAWMLAATALWLFVGSFFRT